MAEISFFLLELGLILGCVELLVLTLVYRVRVCQVIGNTDFILRDLRCCYTKWSLTQMADLRHKHEEHIFGDVEMLYLLMNMFLYEGPSKKKVY